ncbi:hypothetical protein GOP47_0028242 [Adiantum capillus-veneris]|nr:hypothetical protein GOP47_0028242 [Adiantum capillus-veneris]
MLGWRGVEASLASSFGDSSSAESLELKREQEGVQGWSTLLNGSSRASMVTLIAFSVNHSNTATVIGQLLDEVVGMVVWKLLVLPGLVSMKETTKVRKRMQEMSLTGCGDLRWRSILIVIIISCVVFFPVKTPATGRLQDCKELNVCRAAHQSGFCQNSSHWKAPILQGIKCVQSSSPEWLLSHALASGCKRLQQTKQETVG